MENNDYGLTGLHNALLELLVEIDRVCRKNDIRYSVIYGTMIGAWRHHGFIPWDDDADLAFKRADFDKLMACKDQFDPKFQIVAPDALPGKFWDGTTRLIYKGKYMGEKTETTAYYEELHNQAFVDLFVLDETGAGRKLKRQSFRNKMIYGKCMAYRPKITYSKYNSAVQRMEAKVLSFLGKFTKLEKLLAKKEANARRYNGKGMDSYCCFTGFPAVNDNAIPASLCQEYVDVDYCGHQFMSFAHYDELMTGEYGNWRELPKKEDRHPTHQDILL